MGLYRYAFRLCPKGQKLDEACFNRIHLDFEGHQVLRWKDGTEEAINGTYVTEGTHPAGIPSHVQHAPTVAALTVGVFVTWQARCGP